MMYVTGKGFKKIGEGSLKCAFQLFQSLLGLIEEHQIQKPDVYHMEDKLSDNESDNGNE